jgi:hypothetical protein
MVALMQGKLEYATVLYKESLNLAKALGDRLGIAVSFNGLGEVAIQQGQFARAARLFGAADALRQVIGAPLPQTAREDFERDVALLQSRAGEAEFTRAWSEGRAMTLEQAVAYAGESIEEPQLQITTESQYRSLMDEYAHEEG